jgi:hypothetical protein
VFHYDGTQWNKLDAGVINVDLWWVFGFTDGTVFLGGSGGTILRYRAGTFEKLTTPTPDIVFGMWGSSPDDVWAVGGQLTGRPFVWRYQGVSFMPVSGVPAVLTNGAVWKVTGRSADDVWMSASQGLILHWDGQSLTNEQVGGSEESLFSIGCYTSGCVSAGTNVTNGVLYKNDNNQGWVSDVPTEDGPVWRGVTPTGDNTYVVGTFGAVIHLTPSGWVSDPHALTSESLHATWADADGELFAVGGRFDQIPTTEGILLHKGTETLPTLP